MNRKRQYFEDNIKIVEKFISENRPKFEIARILNLKYDTLCKYLKEKGIDYKGNMNRKGMPHFESQEKLEKYFSNEKYVSAPKLRVLLLQHEIKEPKCEACGLETWNGYKIPLELHHKDGNHFNNSLENLELLCANCHAIKHNYSQKDINAYTVSKYKVSKPKKTHQIAKEKQIAICPICGTEFELKREGQKYCSITCARNGQNKIDNTLLKSYVDKGINNSEIAKILNITETAIRKRRAKLNL